MKPLHILSASVALVAAAHAQNKEDAEKWELPETVVVDGVEIWTPETFELGEGYTWFTEPTRLSRGTLSPSYEYAIAVSDDAMCETAVTNWGWSASSCADIDQMLLQPTAAIDNVLIERPNSDGYISFDDWQSGDRQKQIDGIWRDLKAGLRAQSENLGVEITADDWLVYPTLDEEGAYMYYATRMIWDGEPVINIEATRFDRRGYVLFNLVPARDDLTEDQLRAELETVLASYQPNEGTRYADFEDGDKVAAVGALGLLAALTAGAKLGKAGLLAAALVFLKKFWFLILAPFALIGRLLRGGNKD